MNYPLCSKENEVRRAVKSGKLESDLRRHLDSCSACQQVFQVSQWLNEFVDTAYSSSKVPDYGLVWLKAQFLEQHQNANKIIRPLLMFELFAGVIVGVVLLAMLFFNSTVLQEWFAAFISDPTVSQDISDKVITLSTIVLGFLFLIATFLATAASFARDD